MTNDCICIHKRKCTGGSYFGGHLGNHLDKAKILADMCEVVKVMHTSRDT